ncbi:L-malyl-CoA/beta-methylmalyl-CoA lyase [Usitatibacter rugosus]|uniref:L-malyl-CoA/beta-methylmalyl-CoA lyase n=1 Tax=Usitatibacter rugosus TaxID=2732067 RepID=A0A6M4GRT9_9PROT|nr:CoA ester lyase [Usitatibacter rugosus]QJR09528.1 L-malyl-CoA/beta-methylmalyl-CoA lyase [Usitatibacter rugosus]
MRSLLAVPATNPRFLEKGAQSDADAVFIDLEDAVIPSLKVEGRAKAIAAINTLDWGKRILCVRVNDLGTQWAASDLRELAACARLDRVILPKCETPDDVATASELLHEGEMASKRTQPVAIAALVETAKGVANAEAIAACRGRLGAMIFGSGDYQLDVGVLPSPVNLAGSEPRFDFALARIANAARAYGLAPIDGPYFDIANPDGMRAASRHAASFGFEGKMAIHPTQVAIANEVFSPSAEQLAWAREVLEAMAAAGEAGQGAVKTKDGRMIDLVHIKIARKVIERAERNATRR